MSQADLGHSCTHCSVSFSTQSNPATAMNVDCDLCCGLKYFWFVCMQCSSFDCSMIHWPCLCAGFCMFFLPLCPSFLRHQVIKAGRRVQSTVDGFFNLSETHRQRWMFTGASIDLMVTRDDSLLRDAEGASVDREASNSHPVTYSFSELDGHRKSQECLIVPWWCSLCYRLAYKLNIILYLFTHLDTYF